MYPEEPTEELTDYPESQELEDSQQDVNEIEQDIYLLNAQLMTIL